MKKTKLIAKTTISIFLIQTFLLQSAAWSQIEPVLAAKRADYLAPALHIQADSFKAIISALKTELIPFALPERADRIINLLQDDKVELDRKLNIIAQLAQKPIDDPEFLQKLKDVFLKHQRDFLAHALGLLLLRNNPAFWFKEEYTRMDEAKFRQLLKRRGIALDEEKERFARFLERMNQRREKLIAEDSEAWAYPYNCVRFSGIMLMEELKAAGFRADIVGRQSPLSGKRFGIHAYLIVTLGQEEFIVDVTAAQFHKVSHDMFEETGIVIVPLADIRKNPEAFEIYTQGQTLRNHFIIVSSPAYAAGEQAVLQKIAGEVKFVADAKKVAAEMNIAKVRQEIAANPRLYKAWHAQDKTLKEKLNAFDDQKVLEALGLDEFSAKLAALQMYFKDKYGVKNLRLIEKDECINEGNMQDEKTLFAIKTEKMRRQALKLFVQIDAALRRHARLAAAFKLLCAHMDIELAIAHAIHDLEEGQVEAFVEQDTADPKQKKINFALKRYNSAIAYGGRERILGGHEEWTLLEFILGHELAHLFFNMHNDFILPLDDTRQAQLQALARKVFGMGLNVNRQRRQQQVYEFAEYLWTDRMLNLMHRFKGQAFTDEQIQTEFITVRSFASAKEFLAEALALFVADPAELRAADKIMFEFLELIADWPKVFNAEKVDVVLTQEAARAITSRARAQMIEQAI
ncbi:MAG: hypothetical protein ABII75_09560 [Candidatus Omnitrophota bacterium]